ncbi:RluA family pseudouridine synthase [Sporomusa acidovorans]|uniref:Pseudouridine synthase n=1 Tax=Sporomusa acidovorans (strain ATCC 49682 / DSM 3132 / Mol) TaxID=1123286 RepID=A0ABZ3J133_SPOA4|nr:RluA family pseudouridine synthase [Sporomusa acidovorans]OZC22820.1 ribosomal large subunit pseudouridine synthase D [Sporomusa acidovorans DSM 3132]SDE52024.1 23S rRNA pseudouridine1911/1915/1917 synthase [Sporomusa acidovorans]
MKSFQSVKISPEHAGQTVETYLKQVLQLSGRKIQKLTRQKGVFLNGRPVFLQKQLKLNDTLRVLVLQDVAYGVEPEPGAIEILYEDNCLLVVNKPPFQLVHPTGQTITGTLANYLAHYLAEQGILTTIRAVHRLDRETSGCVIFAKDSRSQTLLEQQLKDKTLTRSYQALIKGSINPPFGKIEAPIGPHPSFPNRRAINPQGEAAITHYRTIQSFSDATLLALTLETGRTHQIRVHLAHIGHPILGDRMYGIRTPLISRQALHANLVHFEHLENKQVVTVEAPLPADFTRLIHYCDTNQPE